VPIDVTGDTDGSVAEEVGHHPEWNTVGQHQRSGGVLKFVRMPFADLCHPGSRREPFGDVIEDRAAFQPCW